MYIVTTEQISAVLPRFCMKSPTFGKSYSTRNILPRFGMKSPTFGKSYRSRNILTRVVQKMVNPKVNPKVIKILNPLRPLRGF